MRRKKLSRGRLEGRPHILEGRSCIAVGAFDGVHFGHRAVIGGMVRSARAQDMPAIVFTFDPLPKVFFNAAQALFSLRDRLDALYALGVDHVHVERFDAEYAARPPSLFLDELASLGAEEVHVGDDFRFGSGRGGNAALLRERFRVVEHAGVLCARGERISSSRLRALYSGRDFAGMTSLLGVEGMAVLAG